MGYVIVSLIWSDVFQNKVYIYTLRDIVSFIYYNLLICCFKGQRFKDLVCKDLVCKGLSMLGLSCKDFLRNQIKVLDLRN